MHIVALLFGVVAAVVAFAEYLRSRPSAEGGYGNLLALALGLFIVAWILATIWVTKDPVTIGGA